MASKSPAERRFAERIARRRTVFLVLSLAGVAVAAALTAYYGFRRWSDPDYELGLRFVVIVLILLNARLNLRQYRIAGVLRGRPEGHGRESR